jgi:hypothetical protein
MPPSKAVRYEWTTDRYGCFSFQNFTFQVVTDNPIARKKILCLFSEWIGFKVYAETEVQGISNSRKTGHLPEAPKRLPGKYYGADDTEPGSAVP